MRDSDRATLVSILRRRNRTASGNGSVFSYPGGGKGRSPNRGMREAERGVGDGNRTHNVRSHSPVLCQLSYTHHMWKEELRAELDYNRRCSGAFLRREQNR